MLMAFPAPHLYPLNADLFVKYVDNQHNCNTRGNQIRNSGRRFYDGKYKSHFDNLFQFVFKAMDEDPTNKLFGEDWAQLTRKFLFDSEGKFKLDLWKDIRTVILPTLVDKMCEFIDETIALALENMTLAGRNLFPNIVAIEAHQVLAVHRHSR
jgi:hypothetical protein